MRESALVHKKIIKSQKTKQDMIKIIKKLKQDYQLYLLALPALVYIFIFSYMPMYGVQIAFKNFSIVKGISGSPWVGFDHFIKFFNSYQFWPTMKNTLGLSIFSLIVNFPIPIVLALLLNQVRSTKFKKTVQTITYAPHFISLVVMVSMIMLMLSPNTGIVNKLIEAAGGTAINFMGEASMFKFIYVFSDLWQNMGWASIIYLAALASISPELYEAAKIDGANKFQQIVHVDLPGIIPTAIIMLVLAVGRIMSMGADKALLMQNSLNLSSSEILSTYVYKVGLIGGQYSYTTAIGLFLSLINIILLISVNKIAKIFSETSLW